MKAKITIYYIFGRNIIGCLICFLLTFSIFLPNGWTQSYGAKVEEKLMRGGDNTFIIWKELPHTIGKTKEKHGFALAATWGTAKGLGRSCLRLLVGIYELSTFFIPQKPLLEELKT